MVCHQNGRDFRTFYDSSNLNQFWDLKIWIKVLRLKIRHKHKSCLENHRFPHSSTAMLNVLGIFPPCLKPTSSTPLLQPLQDMCAGSSRYPSIESIGSCMTQWSTGAPCNGWPITDQDVQNEWWVSRKAKKCAWKIPTELNLAQTTSSGSTNSHGTCAKPHWNNIWSNFMASGPKRPAFRAFLG